MIYVSGRCVTLKRSNNFHAHFRQGGMLELMVRLFLEQGWQYVLAMPNTLPPVLCAEDVIRYREELLDAIDKISGELKLEHRFEPLFTIQITEDTTPTTIGEAIRVGTIAGKVYPKDMTTHSANGVADYEKIYPALEAMQNLGMVACFHGEHPSSEVEGLDKEARFLAILFQIAKRFPKLRIVLEHITTKEAVDFIDCCGPATGCCSIAATITVHHLVLTTDDVIGYSAAGGYLMRPHNMCKPVAKKREDRQALLRAATSGDPRFFYGGDDAPHPSKSKHCAGVCAGVFNTHVALPLLAEIFEVQGCIERLEDFVSTFGTQFYGLREAEDTITLVVNDSWQVPESVSIPGSDDVAIPWQAGVIPKYRLLKDPTDIYR